MGDDRSFAAEGEPSDEEKGLKMRARNHFRIDVGRSVGYCYIRKNACSAFKKLVVDTSRAPGSARSNVKPRDRLRYMTEHHRLSRRDLKGMERVILVLRDPIDRVVSGYLNQFVLRLDRRAESMHPVVESAVGKRAGDVTFRDFVERYLGETSTRLWNKHFVPQIDHVYPMRYSDVVWQGDLEADMGFVIGRSLARTYFGRQKNAVRHSDVGATTRASNLSAHRLLRRYQDDGDLPRKDAFLPDELRACLGDLYADDVRLFAWFMDLRQGKAGPVAMDVRGRLSETGSVNVCSRLE